MKHTPPLVGKYLHMLLNLAADFCIPLSLAED
jgi:hypothetical protein